MSQPPAYNRVKDFTEDFGNETDHSALNAELDAAGNSINDIRANLAILQADDGKLRPDVVTVDSVTDALFTALVDAATEGAGTSQNNAEAAALAAHNSALDAQASAVTAETHKNAAAIAEANAAASVSDAADVLADVLAEVANLVHTTGNETIAGVKTFSDTPVIPYINASKVSGLTGNVNATTPLTKYDLSANAVTLRNSVGGTLTRYNTGTLTVDLSGRGFSANSWIYLYFTWNDATLIVHPSTVTPAAMTSADLPTGYTHWAFATVLRWNASSNIIPAYMRGSTVHYDLAAGSAANRILNAGTASAMTAVSAAGIVPPIALRAKLNVLISAVHSTVDAEFNVSLRPTGSTISGIFGSYAVVQVAGRIFAGLNTLDIPLGTSQQIDYKLTPTPSTTGGAYIEVLGYTIPNGDA